MWERLVKMLLLQRIVQRFHFKVHSGNTCSHIKVISGESRGANSAFKAESQLAQLLSSRKQSIGGLWGFYFVFLPQDFQYEFLEARADCTWEALLNPL